MERTMYRLELTADNILYYGALNKKMPVTAFPYKRVYTLTVKNRGKMYLINTNFFQNIYTI